MASKKFLELQELSVERLQAELEATENDYRKLQMDNALKGLDNPLELRIMRRDVARLNTEIRRRELAEATPEELAKRSRIRARRSRKH